MPQLFIPLEATWELVCLFSFGLGWLVFVGMEIILIRFHCFFHNAFVRRSFYSFGSNFFAYMRISLHFSIVQWWVGFYKCRHLFLNVRVSTLAGKIGKLKKCLFSKIFLEELESNILLSKMKLEKLEKYFPVLLFFLPCKKLSLLLIFCIFRLFCVSWAIGNWCLWT